jgi:fused signal recognition particle receptor
VISRLRDRLRASTAGLRGNLTGLSAHGPVDEALWEALEEALIAADMGPELALKLARDLRAESDRLRLKHSSQVMDGLRALLLARMEWRPRALNDAASPTVVLVVGVNGTGKTTTAAKLAARFARDGGKVVLGAADTFRAAATEQLTLWSQRVGCELVAGQPGGDPASVAFASVEAGLARGARAVIIDTAGRLHNRADLMAELGKIDRSVSKALGGPAHEALLVLDAAIGQNSLQQARVFRDGLHLTGAVLAKLDGSSRGGVVLAIEEELGVPVKLVGTGETLDDLDLFDAQVYVDSLFAVRP